MVVKNRLGMPKRSEGQISRINDKEVNIQNRSKYFLKNRPEEKRKDREGVEEGIFNGTENDTEKDMGVGRKVKKVKKEKDRPSEKGETNKEETIKEIDKKEKET